MLCKEESPIILDILSEAKISNDPIKFGLTLHAYADTFTHQGFSGIISKVYNVDKERGFNQVHQGYLYLLWNFQLKDLWMRIKYFIFKESQDK